MIIIICNPITCHIRQPNCTLQCIYSVYIYMPGGITCTRAVRYLKNIYNKIGSKVNI